MLPGVEIATIIEMVLNADRTDEINSILTNHNLRVAIYQESPVA